MYRTWSSNKTVNDSLQNDEILNISFLENAFIGILVFVDILILAV